MALENTVITPPTVYSQYKQLPWIGEYTNIITDYIQENYVDIFKKVFSDINLSNSEERFLFFYTFNYLGLPRPWGVPGAAYFYDEGREYDDEKIAYDTIEYNDGLIDAKQLKSYTRFVFDYSKRVLNLDLIVRFVCESCSCTPLDLVITFNPDSIHLRLPSTDKSYSFLNMLRSNRYLPGLPFGSKIIIWNI